MFRPLYVTEDDAGVTFAAWLTSGIACAPKAMPRDEVERRVLAMDRNNGTEAGWSLAEDTPVVCDHDPEKLHHLFRC